MAASRKLTPKKRSAAGRNQNSVITDFTFELKILHLQL
jgi:hypothetical protein